MELYYITASSQKDQTPLCVRELCTRVGFLMMYLSKDKTCKKYAKENGKEQ